MEWTAGSTRLERKWFSVSDPRFADRDRDPRGADDPDLAAAVSEHLARLRRLGAPTGPRAFLIRTCAAGAAIVAGSRAYRQRPAAGPASSSCKKACHRYRTRRAHAQAHLHLDRAAREQLRREMGDGPGRARRFAHDDGRLCLARAACEARDRRELRPARAPHRRDTRRAAACSSGVSSLRYCGTRIARSRPRTAGSSSSKRHRIGARTQNRGARGPIFTRRPVPHTPAFPGVSAKWRDPDSNRGHHDFQSCALPAELSRRWPIFGGTDATG